MRLRFALLSLLVSAAPLLGQKWFSVPLVLDPTQGSLRTAADLNSDGRPELLQYRWAPSSAGRSLVIHQNDGAGNFTPLPFPLPDWTGEQLFVAEVTGDGTPDLLLSSGVFTLGAPTSLLVFPGNGLGSFLPMIATPIGKNVMSMDLGDVDGDGILDLAVRGQVFGAPTFDLQWYRSTGSGTFVSGPSLPLPAPGFSVPFNLATFDYDLDGRPDIVGCDEVGATMSVYLSAPNWALVPSAPYVVGLGNGYGRTVKADITGDGRLDLVTWANTPFNSQFVSVQVAQPLGGVQVRPAITTAYCPSGAVIPADWNQDGFTDVFVHGGGQNGQAPWVLLAGSSSGDLSQAWTESGTALLVSDFRGGVGADFDGDGRTDVAGGVDVVFGDGTLRPWIESLVGLSTTLSPLLAADREDDGDPDFVMSGGGASGTWSVNDGRGLFTPNATPWPPLLAGANRNGVLPLGDLNGNGRLDLVSTQSFQFNVFTSPTLLGYRRYEIGGNGITVDAGPLSSAGLQFSGSLTADLDLDGDLDLVGQGYQQNDGTGLFGPILNPWAGWVVGAAADIDADGDPDLLAHSATAAPPQVAMIVNAWPSFIVTPIALPYPTALGEASRMQVGFADLDADGDPDGFAAMTGFSDVAYLINQNGSFSLGGTLSYPSTQTGPHQNLAVAGDVDGDGRIDLLLRDALTFWVFRSIGPGLTFAPPVSFHFPYLSGLRDLNGDGDLDLLGQGTLARSHRFLAPESGEVRQFGTPTLGTGGNAPILGAFGPQRPGSVGFLRLRNALGGAPCLLTAAAAPASLPDFPLPGLITYGQPWVFFLPLTLGGLPGVAGEGRLDVGGLIPPSFAGASLTWQFAAGDPGHPSGITVSGGLEIRYGQ